MGQLLTTESVAPRDRVDWWGECVRKLFGAEYRIAPGVHAPFRMEVAIEGDRPMSLLAVSGSAHHAQRLAEAGPDAMLVHLQVEGHVTALRDGAEHRLEPRSLFVMPLDRPPDLRFETAYRQVAAILPVAAVASVFPEWRRRAMMRIPATRGIAATLADHLCSLAQHPEVLGNARAAQMVGAVTVGLFAATLHSLDESAMCESHGLAAFHRARIRQFVQLHLCNPALDVTFVAGGVGLSERYVHKLFAGEPQRLMHWIRIQRLERAAMALADDAAAARNIGRVAYSCGFNDQAHFSRSFRKHFGFSPQECRSGVREGRRNA